MEGRGDSGKRNVFDRLGVDKVQVANFLAGGIAGTVASALTMPLEVLKTQLQTSIVGQASLREIVGNIFVQDGFKGFFKGIQPMMVGIIPTRGIYFWAYNASKDELSPFLHDSPYNHLISAFAAGITSNTVSNPLWMVKTRFQIMANASLGQRHYVNYSEVIEDIWKKEGIRGFYKGLTASYFGCFEGAIHWILYERFKVFLSSSTVEDAIIKSDKQLRVIEYFGAAALAKFVAIWATYPHEVVRTRMREQAKHGVFKYSGFLNTFKSVWNEGGLRALYSGVWIHLARSVPNAAIMFMTFEVASSWIKEMH